LHTRAQRIVLRNPPVCASQIGGHAGSAGVTCDIEDARWLQLRLDGGASDRGRSLHLDAGVRRARLASAEMRRS